MESENQNPGIKRYQFGEHLKSSNNTNTCQNCRNLTNLYETKFEQLTESVKQLNGSIEELTATNVSQNTVIMEALATQKVLLEKLLGKEKKEANIRKMFPIQAVDDLEDIDNKIKEANRAVYIRCISSLIKGKLHKSLTEIFSVDVIIDCNIDGIHGKHSLKSFKRLFGALMDAVRDNGEENPDKAIRTALKLIKKRHFQAVCVSKKKENLPN